MIRKINGSLYVDTFVPTEIPGQYTFENALFNNQADLTGAGTYDITVGFLIHIPATDPNSFVMIPGMMSRYVLTSIEYINNVAISGTVNWDMPGDITDVPTNGVFCMVSDSTDTKKLAIPPIDSIYPDIMSGSTISAVLNDLVNIVDKMGSGATTRTTTKLDIQTNGQLLFTLPYTPNDKTNTLVTVNGLVYAYGVDNDYTIDANVLTWTDVSLVLDVSDNIVVSFTH